MNIKKVQMEKHRHQSNSTELNLKLTHDAFQTDLLTSISACYCKQFLLCVVVFWLKFRARKTPVCIDLGITMIVMKRVPVRWQGTGFKWGYQGITLLVMKRVPVRWQGTGFKWGYQGITLLVMKRVPVR